MPRPSAACEALKGARMARTKREVMAWIDEQLACDAVLRQQVDERLNAMRLEQELTALREARGLSQSQVAQMMGVSQPAIAKIESGKAKNLQLKTLVRMVTALNGQIKIVITPRHQPQRRRAKGQVS